MSTSGLYRWETSVGISAVMLVVFYRRFCRHMTRHMAIISASLSINTASLSDADQWVRLPAHGFLLVFYINDSPKMSYRHETNRETDRRIAALQMSPTIGEEA